jgi:ribosome recycling factor
MSTYETNPELIQKADKKVCDVLDELIKEKEKQFLIYSN